MSKTYKIDLRGQRFNSLTIIDFVPREHTRNAFWLCQCDCGSSPTVVEIGHLRSGHTKTCGNCKWVNKKFGYLTVLEETNEKTNDGHKIVKCQCECGRIYFKGVDSLKKGSLTANCGCISCSTGETLIEEILITNEVPFKKQYTFKDLKGDKALLRFDFAVFNEQQDLKFLIEFDGKQHFEESEKLGGHEGFIKRKRYDALKDEYCESHNLKLVRISYKELSRINYDYIMKAAGY